MIANFGFDDGSGAYYISLDTNKCCECKEKSCLNGCPAGIFTVEFDDWDNEIVVLKTSKRNKIKSICEQCKPIDNRPELLPCQIACPLCAIVHSW